MVMSGRWKEIDKKSKRFAGAPLVGPLNIEKKIIYGLS